MPTATPFDVAEGLATEAATAAHQPASDRVPRVLLIRRRYLGDIVLLGSVLRNLRLRWPHAWISVLTASAYSGVLRLNPDVDSALVFPRRKKRWVGCIRALRRIGCFCVIDSDTTEKTALVTRLSGAA